MTNVLFVCGKARMRSPTAADVLARWPDINTDFAGLSRDADEFLVPQHLDWADIIFVMEHKQKKRLRDRIGQQAGGLKLISLDIPDKYKAHEPALVDILVQKLTTHFGPMP